jgi:SAM-dependent methyltransferase
VRARDWDAASYEHVGAPVRAFGHALLERLELRGDERVLDAGCGSGGVTRELIARVPDGRVIGVDASPSMIEQASAAFGEAAEWRVGDLLELGLEQPVDVVFSSATFHWIPDHDRLFARLFAALRPGGRLVIAEFVRPAEPEEAAGHNRLERLRGHHYVEIYERPRLEAMLAAAGCPMADARTARREMSGQDWLSSPNVAPEACESLQRLIEELERSGGAGLEVLRTGGGVRFVRRDLVLLGVKCA